MHCRGKKSTDFRTGFGFNQHHLVMSKEQSVTTKIKLFSNEKILLQHPALSYRFDLYFLQHKLAIEIDEKEYRDEFARINPDGKDYYEYVEFGRIINYINKSNEKLTKESTKKSLIDNLSKILPKIKFRVKLFNKIKDFKEC